MKFLTKIPRIGEIFHAKAVKNKPIYLYLSPVGNLRILHVNHSYRKFVKLIQPEKNPKQLFEIFSSTSKDLMVLFDDGTTSKIVLTQDLSSDNDLMSLIDMKKSNTSRGSRPNFASFTQQHLKTEESMLNNKSFLDNFRKQPVDKYLD